MDSNQACKSFSLGEENDYAIAYTAFVSKRKFGLELEFGNKISKNTICEAVQKVDQSRETVVSGHYTRDTDNDFYHVKLDHSCGDDEGDYGVELASFKASGIKDIKTLSRVTKSIKLAGANVNERCAAHVHAEITDFSNAQLAVMTAIWIKLEPFICHMIPSHRANSKYCRFFRHENWVAETIINKEPLTPAFVWSKVKPTKNNDINRRKSMNLCNYVFTERKTVEFRFPESTVNDSDVKNWLRFLLSFVEISKNAAMPLDLEIYDFPGFLKSFGLYGKNPFLILSSGMRATKIWALERIIKFSRSIAVTTRAKEHLAFCSRIKENNED